MLWRSRKRVVSLVVLGLLFMGIIGAVTYGFRFVRPGITTFEECIAHGNPVMESYPRRCQAGERTFTEDIDPKSFASEIKNKIIITEPKADQEVYNPMLLQGKAQVTNNTFSYRVIDEDGTVLVENQLTYATSDTGVVGEFIHSIQYNTSKGTRGKLEIFSNSPQDGSEINAVSIPIRFVTM